MLGNNYNILLDVDAYKFSHYLQYRPGVQRINSYIESRGGIYPRTLFFGLQAYLLRYLSEPFTQAHIDEAESLAIAMGLPFNRQGWQYILSQHKGMLPVRIAAVAEGSVVPTGNVLVQIQNTDPQVPWLGSYLETQLLRAIWYPTTVATVSWSIKQDLLGYLRQTSDDPTGQIAFKLHDFGARGVSSYESSCLGGLAHLVNFQGSDTTAAVLYGRRFYSCPQSAFSIPAAEHSTITSWGPSGELDAFRNMLIQFGGKYPLIAVVSDSYNIWDAVDQEWGTILKDEVIDSGSTIVVRGDSGDPRTVPVQIVERLGARFGWQLNGRGYKILHPAIRVIQGDGINQAAINAICKNLIAKGWAIDNIAFGMGGALLQQINRDTLKFAQKASAEYVNGQWIDMYKDPVTDPGKASKRGVLALVRENGIGSSVWRTVREDGLGTGQANELSVVWADGRAVRTYTFDDIRSRSIQPL